MKEEKKAQSMDNLDGNCKLFLLFMFVLLEALLNLFVDGVFVFNSLQFLQTAGSSTWVCRFFEIERKRGRRLWKQVLHMYCFQIKAQFLEEKLKSWYFDLIHTDTDMKVCNQNPSISSWDYFCEHCLACTYLKPWNLAVAMSLEP